MCSLCKRFPLALQKFDRNAHGLRTLLFKQVICNSFIPQLRSWNIKFYKSLSYAEYIYAVGFWWFLTEIWTWNESPEITAIIFIILWDYLMFYQFFLSPQVKRCTIITCKHGIYELPQELPNDLRLRVLGNYEILGKYLRFIEW